MAILASRPIFRASSTTSRRSSRRAIGRTTPTIRTSVGSITTILPWLAPQLLPTTGICPNVTWPGEVDTDGAFADLVLLLHTNTLRDCRWGRKATSEPTSYRTVVHESTHALFNIPDEYCCDGGYYVDYNTLLLGGSGVAGEKSWQIFCVFGLFPLRIVAAWGFMKMKRWGFDMMLITSWIYAIFWFGYILNMSVDFENRMGASVFGVVGWWVFDIWYITPFVILPWMYAVNRRKWNR